MRSLVIYRVTIHGEINFFVNIAKKPLDIPLMLQYIPRLRCDAFFDK